MRADRAAIRMSSDQLAMRSIVDRQTPVKTLPSLAVGKHGSIGILLMVYEVSSFVWHTVNISNWIPPVILFLRRILHPILISIPILNRDTSAFIFIINTSRTFALPFSTSRNKSNIFRFPKIVN